MFTWPQISHSTALVVGGLILRSLPHVLDLTFLAWLRSHVHSWTCRWDSVQAVSWPQDQGRLHLSPWKPAWEGDIYSGKYRAHKNIHVTLMALVQESLLPLVDKPHGVGEKTRAWCPPLKHIIQFLSYLSFPSRRSWKIFPSVFLLNSALDFPPFLLLSSIPLDFYFCLPGTVISAYLITIVTKTTFIDLVGMALLTPWHSLSNSLLSCFLFFIFFLKLGFFYCLNPFF